MDPQLPQLLSTLRNKFVSLIDSDKTTDFSLGMYNIDSNDDIDSNLVIDYCDGNYSIQTFRNLDNREKDVTIQFDQCSTCDEVINVLTFIPTRFQIVKNGDCVWSVSIYQ